MVEVLEIYDKLQLEFEQGDEASFKNWLMIPFGNVPQEDNVRNYYDSIKDKGYINLETWAIEVLIKLKNDKT